MDQSAKSRPRRLASIHVVKAWLAHAIVLLLVGALVDRASSCEPSSLSGFSNSVDLSGNGLVLHWTLNASRLQFALEAKPASGAESGWFSVGWAANHGRMYPADCVIGNLRGSSVGAYYISGYSQSDVAPSDGLSRSQIDGGAAPASVAATSPPGLSLVKEECFLDSACFSDRNITTWALPFLVLSPSLLLNSSPSFSSRPLSSSTPLPPSNPLLPAGPLNQEETEGLCQRASVAASSSGLFPFPSPPTHPPPPICRFSRSEGDGGAVPVSFNGSNSLNWAFSDSGSTELAFHGNNA
ncbi:unnamed protein product [Closterium sp. NIES-64]|nr:unnamed protein product [Closterium sp. NIES-64]